MIVFLAQLVATVLGAIAGFTLGAMLIVEVEGQGVSMHLVMAGVGAVVGFGIGHVISRAYQREVAKEA